MFPYPLISIDYDEDVIYIDDLELSESDEEICFRSASGINKMLLSSELKELYNRGNIGLGIRAVSPLSYFEGFHEIDVGAEFEYCISKKELSTSLQIDIILFTKKETTIQFRNIDKIKFKELPDVDVPAKSFLGSLIEYKYWFFQERQRSVASIVKLNMESDHFGFDLDSDKIHVNIPKSEVGRHVEIKENGELIFALYVFPALVQAMSKVFDARQKLDTKSDYNQYKWFDYLEMKINTLGLTESDPISASRELLEPINVHDSIISQLYESSH